MRSLFFLLTVLLASSEAYANPWFEANRRCKDKWQDDKKMREYCINRQIDAYNHMPRTSSEIESHCDLKWGTDWSMKKYCIERQNESSGGVEVIRTDSGKTESINSTISSGDSAAEILSAIKDLKPERFTIKQETPGIVYCRSCRTGTYYDKSLSGKKAVCFRCKLINIYP